MTENIAFPHTQVVIIANGLIRSEYISNTFQFVTISHKITPQGTNVHIWYFTCTPLCTCVLGGVDVYLEKLYMQEYNNFQNHH